MDVTCSDTVIACRPRRGLACQRKAMTSTKRARRGRRISGSGSLLRSVMERGRVRGELGRWAWVDRTDAWRMISSCVVSRVGGTAAIRPSRKTATRSVKTEDLGQVGLISTTPRPPAASWSIPARRWRAWHPRRCRAWARQKRSHASRNSHLAMTTFAGCRRGRRTVCAVDGDADARRCTYSAAAASSPVKADEAERIGHPAHAGQRDVVGHRSCSRPDHGPCGPPTQGQALADGVDGRRDAQAAALQLDVRSLHRVGAKTARATSVRPAPIKPAKPRISPRRAARSPPALCRPAAPAPVRAAASSVGVRVGGGSARPASGPPWRPTCVVDGGLGIGLGSRSIARRAAPRRGRQSPARRAGARCRRCRRRCASGPGSRPAAGWRRPRRGRGRLVHDQELGVRWKAP